MRIAPSRALVAVAALAAVCACGGHGHGGLLPATAHRTLAGAAVVDYSQVVLADAPSAYYRLDDTTSVAKDTGPNGYNGTVGASVVEGAAGLLTGSTDTAMSFPGTATTAGTVTFAQNAALQPSSSVSLEAWFRFAATPATYSVVVAYGSDRAYAPYDLFFRANATLVAQFYTSAGVLEVADPTPLAVSTTYHVVSTYDGATGRLYVNGVLVASGTKSGSLTGYLPNYGFAIGDDAQFDDPAFKGTIDEVAVYAGKALSAAQILNHYNAGTGNGGATPTPSPTPTATPTPGPTPNPGQYPAVILADAPTAYYQLDDSGTNAADASGHGYTGTIGAGVTKNAPGLLTTSSDTAMTFPGTASAAGVVSVPATAAMQPLSNVSLEAWLRFTATPPQYTVAVGYGTDSFYAPYELFFRTNGQIVAQFYLSSGVLEVPSATALSANSTYHVVSTYDGTTGRVYVNGVQTGAVAKSGTLANYVIGSGLTIGDDAGFSDPAFRGALDEVAVYAGKTLTAAQVQQHYAAGTSSVATPTPAPTPTPGVDWWTMGFDVQRTGYNPSEKTISAANAPWLHALWATPYSLAGGEIGEPVYASNVAIGSQFENVLYAASGTGLVAAIDADTGKQIWTKQLGTVQYMCGTGTYTFGSNGAPVFDRSTNRLYVGDGQAQVHALDMRTGTEITGWPVTIASPADHNFIYGALTLNKNNGKLYATTSSTCDISPWYGRVVAIDTTTATLGNTFYPTQGSSGGGIWGFGGASVDPSTNDVYIATGNADGANQAAFYAEQVLGLSADLSTILGHSYATLPPSSDADYGATPLLFQPPGCAPLVAAVNKSGIFALWNRASISAGPTQTIQMSISTDNGDFVGVPAYDPVTNLVYVGLPSTFGIYKPGLGAFRIRTDCTLDPTPAWNAAFGADGAVLTSDDTLRSPIAIANGVVFVNDYDTGVAYAFDATAGTQLWSKTLSGRSPVGPIVANGHLYVSDITGKINALTP